MQKIICPKCKSDSGFSKDRNCSSGWRCDVCNICCVIEKRVKKEKQKKQTKQLTFWEI